MSSSRPRPKIEIPGATRTTAAESREVLQRRMVFLGKLGLCVTVAYQALHRIISWVSPEFSEVFNSTFAVGWVSLLGPVVFLVLWAGSRHPGATLSFLRGLDGGAMFAAGVVLSLAGLERVILSCLAKEPEDRPASAEELLEALDGCGDAGGWGQKEAREWWERRGRR